MKEKLSIGKRFILVLLMVMVMIITGCSTNKNASSNKNENGDIARSGGTLVVVRLSDAENLDHHFMNTINAASITHGKVYEGLVGRDKDAQIQPLLAKSWKQIDSHTWELN